MKWKAASIVVGSAIALVLVIAGATQLRAAIVLRGLEIQTLEEGPYLAHNYVGKAGGVLIEKALKKRGARITGSEQGVTLSYTTQCAYQYGRVVICAASVYLEPLLEPKSGLRELQSLWGTASAGSLEEAVNLAVEDFIQDYGYSRYYY